jgi:hypothetical protein
MNDRRAGDEMDGTRHNMDGTTHDAALPPEPALPPEAALPPDETFLSDDDLVMASELRSYAARVSPEPSLSFTDRVMAGIAGVDRRRSAGPRAAASRLAASAGSHLRVAFAQASGGSRVPLKVRFQAVMTLLLVALVISAGVALAAGSAATVVRWVVEPPAPAVSSQGQAPGTQVESASPSTEPGSPGSATQPGNTAHPNPSDHPGNTDHPSSTDHPGNTDHPSKTDHPGNTDHPSSTNHPGNTDHPSSTNHPGVKASPSPEPTPTPTPS